MVRMLSNRKNTHKHTNRKAKRLSYRGHKLNRTLAPATSKRAARRRANILSHLLQFGKYDQGNERRIRMKYKRTKLSTDQKIFKRTAQKTKKINVNPTIMRGGISL